MFPQLCQILYLAVTMFLLPVVLDMSLITPQLHCWLKVHISSSTSAHVFFYKCKVNNVRIDLDNYINFCSGHTQCATTGLYLKKNVTPRTSTFRDSFFSELLIGMWNVLPVEIKMAELISSFKEKLKSLLFFQLNNIFNQDNIGTYKLICPKCRSSNVYTVCSC